MIVAFPENNENHDVSKEFAFEYWVDATLKYWADDVLKEPSVNTPQQIKIPESNTDAWSIEQIKQPEI